MVRMRTGVSSDVGVRMRVGTGSRSSIILIVTAELLIEVCHGARFCGHFFDQVLSSNFTDFIVVD